MLSIAKILAAIKSHLPPNFSGDLSSLFPSGYSGSISLLQFFVIFVYKVLVTQGYAENSQGQSVLAPSCYGHFWLGVDGLGNWFFAWIYGDSDRNSDPRQAGFVFKFSPPSLKGEGVGFVDTSRPSPLTLTCYSNTSLLIKDNWPKLLSGGGRMDFQAPPADMSTSAPFVAEGFTTPPYFLPGIKVGPAPGVPSGSSLFPFPSNIPADALTPQGASLVGPQPQRDGGPADNPVFTTLDDPGGWNEIAPGEPPKNPNSQ